MRCIILRSPRCDTLVLKLHAQVSHRNKKWRTRTFVTSVPEIYDANFICSQCKVGQKKCIHFEIRNESSLETNADNAAEALNFDTSKVELSRAQCSHIATFICTLGHHLKERQTQTHYILTDEETPFRSWCPTIQRICHADPYLGVSEKGLFSSGGINLKNLKDVKVKEQ
jgi:hypothetical protein